MTSTREALLRAARATFARDGIEGAKISDIGRAAGVAHGTFYVHFENKAEVVDHLIVEFNREHGRRLVAAAVENLPRGARAVIRGQARAHVDYWRENADLFPVIVDHIARHSKSEPILLRDVSDEVAAFADEVIASCGIKGRVPSREIARIIVNLWRQTGLYVASAPSAKTDDAALALELSTIAIYDALAPGLTDISRRALAAAYRHINERAAGGRVERAKRSGARKNRSA